MAATPTSISVAPLSAIWRFLARRRLSAQSVFLILFFIRGKETSNSASKFNGRPNFHKTSKQRIKCCCLVVILRSLYIVYNAEKSHVDWFPNLVDDHDSCRVPCSYPAGTTISFTVDPGSNSFWLALVIKYVGGPGDIQAVQIQQVK
jgi:hypothetical protein